MRYAILIACLFASHTAFSEEPYYREKRGDRIHTSYLIGSWHVACTGSVYSDKNRSCQLAGATGEKTRSGMFDTDSKGPQVGLRSGRNGRELLSIEPGYRLRDHGTLTLTVGTQEFKVKYGNEGGKPSWRGGDAVPLIRAFVAGDQVHYNYPGVGTRYINCNTSLMGFTKAWRTATAYVGFDPLAASSE